jgi:rhodanese-related sulfurtransferase
MRRSVVEVTSYPIAGLLVCVNVCEAELDMLANVPLWYLTGTNMTTSPARVREITVQELKAMLDSGAPLELWDVRTEDERSIARIEGARLLDQPGVDYLEGLDRDTQLVFHCHHGIRSQAAAQHFLAKGFTNLCNVAGGIEAWSELIDTSVPRY